MMMALLSRQFSSLFGNAYPQGNYLRCLRRVPDAFSEKGFATNDAQNSNLVYMRDHRAVLRFQGTSLNDFLQGMVTNDVRSLSAGTGPLYAALLTPKGKLLYDMFMYPPTGDADTILVDVDKGCAAGVVGWLNRYKLRRPIRIDDASDQYAVWVMFGGAGGQGPGAAAMPSATPPETEWHPDPRLPELGYRTILPADEQPSTSGRTTTVDERAYRSWRYMHGVAEGGNEMPPDKVFPLDFGLDVLNGISYTKGCYIGQERSSFTHFRGVVRRRAMPVMIDPPADLPAGCDLATADGSKLGNLLGSVDGVGLAHLKVREALACIDSGMTLVAPGGTARVVPVRPAWWRPEWGREEDGGMGTAAASEGQQQPQPHPG